MSRVRSALLVAGATALLAPAGAAAAQPDPGAGAAQPVPEAPAPAPPPAADPEAAKQTPGKGADAKQSAGERRSSQIKLRLRGIKRGKLKAGTKFTAAGTLRPFAQGERVTLILRRGSKTVRRKTMWVQEKKGASFGKFHLSHKLLRPGRYSIQAIHHPSVRLAGSKARTRAFRIRYPDLDPGNRNNTVRTFNRLLAEQGYVNDKGKAYDSATERAVLAFRKVNKMSRTTNANPKIFKRLAKGKGGYKIRAPFSGRHVEADLSRQIMVLANGSKVKEIYHVSTGAPATPTIPGTWRFYRKEPGFNSLGMYYSVYYNRGYAIHGYKSVPTYPASHGCLRNPIPNSKHIYDWVDIGMLIHIYR